MKRLWAGLVVGVLAFPAGEARAQQAPAWGDNRAAYQVNPFDMLPSEPGALWLIEPTNAYWYATDGSYILGSVHLPEGSRIEVIELEACDTSPVNHVDVNFFRADADSLDVIAAATTGAVETPGCARVTANPDPALQQVNNGPYRYLVSVTSSGPDATATFGALRVFYVLQVSPAPSVATFNDVLTSDPAFQFIEALFSAGVTAGCGGGNYCPDAPLTRRQMAVFFSRALGLNWPESIAP